MAAEPGRVVLLAGASVGVLACLALAAPYMPAILGATILAVVFHPLHRRIRARLRPASLAAFLSVVCILVLVLVPAVAVTSAAVDELRALYGRAGKGAMLDVVQQRLDPVLAWIASRTGIAADELRNALLERLAQASGAVLRSASNLVGALTEGIVQLVVGVMTLFFLIRDGEAILRRVVGSALLPADQANQLLARAGAAISANMYGVLAVALAQGMLAGVGFYSAGLPSPLLWGLAAAFFSLVPLIGTGIVWVPAVLLLGADGRWTAATLLAAWSAGVVAMADNVVRPWVVGQQLNASPLLVFFSLLGGARLFGLAGLFIGPLILSLTAALLGFVWQQQTPSADGPAGPTTT